MKKYLPLLILCSLAIIAFFSIGSFYDGFSNGRGSPESKSLGAIIGLVVAVRYFLLWCFNISAFYGLYCFFFLNGKSRISAIFFLLIIGIGFYFLREEIIGADGVLPFYILYGVNLLGVCVPSRLK